MLVFFSEQVKSSDTHHTETGSATCSAGLARFGSGF